MAAGITDGIKLFVFDLDGTVYYGDQPANGATDLIDEIRDGYHVAFITNNSSKSRAEIHGKLTRMNIAAEPSSVYVNAVLTGSYLQESEVGDVYVIGSPGLHDEIERAGITIASEESAENLVVGFDINFNYEKIASALTVLERGGRFIACNVDPSFPDGDQRMKPGNGAMVGAISAVSGREPDDIVGKPNTYALKKIMNDFGVTADQTLVVGDSYQSDIVMAKKNNSKSVFVGGSSQYETTDTLVVEDLKELCRYMIEG